MAPRRSASRAGAAASGSTNGQDVPAPSMSGDLVELGQRVAATLESWPTDSPKLHELVTGEVEALQASVDTKLHSARLSQVVLTLLESQLDVGSLSTLLKSLSLIHI